MDRNLTTEEKIQIAEFFIMKVPSAIALILAGQAETISDEAWNSIEGRSKEELRREVDDALGKPDDPQA